MRNFAKLRISIHALREEGDSMGGVLFDTAEISIHALREEGDPHHDADPGETGHFYPRPP